MHNVPFKWDFQLPQNKMLSWIQLLGIFSLALVGAMAEKVSLTTENNELNFMQQAADAEDYLTEVSLDESPGFNITIPRSTILAARRLSVTIPLLLGGNGVNTSFRHCYCFRRLASGE